MTGSPKKKMFINLLLVFLVVALAIVPLVLNSGAKFEGSDGNAEKMITELRPGYKPWYKPLWVPPSGEIESLLFALQAAVGSGFMGYYFGYQRGKKKNQEKA